ncbi:hypothetical protein L3Q82_018650 [Scortum barcoo]|uniref:Uncharacterized protein n=1 Tax=Scortum barcoo TaxID=214431 RepID=A0ACB8VHR1_9TELE|nr:hypothetical protein L3Q82_018650 [Scortum barcoo]
MWKRYLLHEDELRPGVKPAVLHQYSHMQGCVELNGNKTRLPAADHSYDNYVKTGLEGRGRAAKANYQRWQAYLSPGAEPQQEEKLSANPSRKNQMCASFHNTRPHNSSLISLNEPPRINFIREMICMKHICSQRVARRVGAAFSSCRCFHAEQVKHESRALPIIHHSRYVCELPPNHSFPMAKFPRVLHCLIKDQVITDKQVWVPEIASKDLLGCVHTEEYLNNFISGKINEQEQRRTGFPWSEGIVRRCRYETGEKSVWGRLNRPGKVPLDANHPLCLSCSGGTVLAAEVALQRGLACSTAGGTHHAFPSYGSGFCLLNDLAVAAKYLMDISSPKRKVLIVDLDVHQGDGTAFIFKEEPCVFTFSVHCGKNFPLRKQQSDLDISVEDGLEDKEYLCTVEAHLPWLLETFRPDLVLYDAGVDPHWEDELGRLRLTDQGLYQRDLYVMKTVVSRGIPLASVIGGGYSKDIDKLALRHSIVHRAATQVQDTRHTTADQMFAKT